MQDDYREDFTFQDSDENGLDSYNYDYDYDNLYYVDSEDDHGYGHPPTEHKKHSFLQIFILQCAICASIIAIFGGMKLITPQWFENAKTEYIIAAKTGDSFRNGCSNCLEGIQGWINGLTPLQNNTSEESQQTSQPESQPAQEESQPQQQPVAEGGEQNPVSQENVPANCTLNSVIYTQDKTAPLQGNITSCFGTREYPLNGDPDFHTGVDIAAQEGTPIVAMSDGVVEKATYSDGYGNYVKLSHADNFKSLYAHCSSLTVAQGQSVTKGQVIGYVGSTGASTGSHLHFGTQKDGLWCDPAATFPEYQT